MESITAQIFRVVHLTQRHQLLNTIAHHRDNLPWKEIARILHTKILAQQIACPTIQHVHAIQVLPVPSKHRHIIQITRVPTVVEVPFWRVYHLIQLHFIMTRIR